MLDRMLCRSNRGRGGVCTHGQHLDRLHLTGLGERLDVGSLSGVLPGADINLGMALMWSERTEADGERTHVFLESIEKGILLEFTHGGKRPFRCQASYRRLDWGRL